ncbi:MAG: hypothetical protein DRP65_11025 [Planctomycetota bacterium]|nr:MAG: hypothetical protein DRP65_11025 [Planctomycetota bacterium]
MNKMQTIARITLAAIALYIILEFAKHIPSSLYFIGHAGELTLTSLFMAFVATGSMIILVVIIAWQLIVRGEKWACKIVTKAQNYEAEEKTNWLPTTYHIIAVSLGILFIWWTIPYIFQLLYYIKLAQPSSNGQYRQFYSGGYRVLPTLVSVIGRLIISVYLLCGAPHFVRWQIKKTLELCKEFDGNEYPENSQEKDILGG